MRALLCLLMLALLSGCETLKIAATAKIQPQAAPTDIGNLEIVTDAQIKNLNWGNIPDGIADACAPNANAFAAAVWVPLVAKLVFDKASDKASEYVKNVQAESSKSLAFKTVVDSSALSTAQCIVVYRRPLEDQPSGTVPRPSAIVVMKVQQLTNAVRLIPIYAMVKNSISLTKCAADCNTEWPKGNINLALAITAIAPIRTPLDDVLMREFGTVALTVKNVPLGGEAYTQEQKPVLGKQPKATANPIGNPSGIMGLPAINAPMQLSIGLTELGDIAGDPDVALGEIEAAHATLSEGALAEIRAHYERDAAR